MPTHCLELALTYTTGLSCHTILHPAFHLYCLLFVVGPYPRISHLITILLLASCLNLEWIERHKNYITGMQRIIVIKPCNLLIQPSKASAYILTFCLESVKSLKSQCLHFTSTVSVWIWP